VPSMIAVNGVVPNDPNFVATRGEERTGVIADGVTELVFEAEVGGPGRVRFVLDDDDIPGNLPASGTSVGTATALGGGAPQTSLTVTVTLLADGRYVGHAVYTAPQDFIRTAADNPLATRPIRVRATFIDASNREYAMPLRSLDLYRVPVLYVHGMWGDATTFGWPILDDTRWIVHRADYSSTNDVAFAQNVGTPPRLVAELRRKLNARGIAGTRVFVFAHSMGAVLFKIYVGGAGAPYARADDYFAGDVYALVSVDAPFFGSTLAPLMRYIASLRLIGPEFAERMRSSGLNVDRGCMGSLDPASPDILDIPAATGTFHAIAGWGGREMRALGVEVLDESRLESLRNVLRIFNYSFDNYLLNCGSGDDFAVCADSQQGGLASGYVDNFHYVDGAAKAVHFNSICRETAPSVTAERLLNTPTTNVSVWGLVLPKAPPSSLGGGETSVSLAAVSVIPASGSAMGGYPITILGSAFGAATKVRIGAFHASEVAVVNSTTITCRMMPGNPGETTITVINEAGQAATATFTYTDPGPIPGGVEITAPADGAVAAAGSTITVSAIGSGGFAIAGALVSSAAFSADDDRDAGAGFATSVTLPADSIGPLTIELLAKDANGNVKSAAPVTITAVVPGNVSLVRLDAEKSTLLCATPTRQLRVYGIYSDGIRREVTHAPGILYEMDTQDPRKPNYPYNGTGVAVVDAAGVITAKTRGSTVCHVSYCGRKIDVVVEVADIRPTVTLQKPGFISWPYQGPGITYDVVRGKLSTLRATGGNYADPSIGTACIKDNFANVTAADAANPPTGDGFFYLLRESRTLSYEESPFWATRSQFGQRTAEINAAQNTCP